ncbi:SMP-30/gluconolactonase/LRE family protein [Sphingorhabdus sp. Alg239-R122]|uniref:SMP-30/gluconolactonase/LRE family protein n=1 Tax=Sphingorhabdus sp. Alg239-R122 TaxID=2305989 RepID=UPI0013D9E1C8|nr:SMP-30/gluconolactonase/LRE family protein [Sphingorhabdus sp. Alg239-R122]
MFCKITTRVAMATLPALLVATQPVFAGETHPEPVRLGEVPNLPASESIMYDTARDMFYVSVMGGDDPGDGYIASITTDGKTADRSFITGLDEPKGSAVAGNRLYVSDGKELAEVNLDDKSIVRHAAPGAVFLNDVAADAEGNIYISDTGQSAIYKFDTDKNLTLWMKTNLLNRPNGLLIEGETMYVASWGERQGEGDDATSNGRLLEVDMKSHAIEAITPVPVGNIDGVQRYGKDGFLISEWNGGKIYHVSGSGKAHDILTPGQSVGDILYHPGRKQLFLPMNRQGKLLVYSLGKPK